MEKRKWGIVIFLTMLAVCFLAFSLYKKRAPGEVFNTDNSSGTLYNLVKLNAVESDSLKASNEYLYLLHRGVYFSENGRPDSAMFIFKKAIIMQPQAAFVQCQLGKAFMQTAQYDSALFYLNKAIQLKPDFRIAQHYKDITIHRKNGETDYEG